MSQYYLVSWNGYEKSLQVRGILEMQGLYMWCMVL